MTMFPCRCTASRAPERRFGGTRRASEAGRRPSRPMPQALEQAGLGQSGD